MDIMPRKGVQIWALHFISWVIKDFFLQMEILKKKKKQLMTLVFLLVECSSQEDRELIYYVHRQSQILRSI